MEIPREQKRIHSYKAENHLKRVRNAIKEE